MENILEQKLAGLLTEDSHDVKVGDIFVTENGSSILFYKITKVTPNGVYYNQIEVKHSQGDKEGLVYSLVTPVQPIKLRGSEYKAQIRFDSGGPGFIPQNSGRSLAKRWDGKPVKEYR